MPKPALAVICGFLISTATAYAQTPPPADKAAAVPEHQTTFAQDGIRLTLGAVRFGQPKDALTLIIENERTTPVRFASLTGRQRSGVSQAVLSDNSGAACMAEGNPTGIAQIQHLSQAQQPPIASMTTIPPRSRMNAVFLFGACHLAGPPLSFAGEFAVSTNGGDAELITVPFWGIVPKAGHRQEAGRTR
jgi:hypothetical protein